MGTEGLTNHPSGLEHRTIATTSTLPRPAPHTVMFRLLCTGEYENKLSGKIKQFSVRTGYVVVLEIVSQEQRNAPQ